MSVLKAYNWKRAVTPKLSADEMAAEGRRPFQTNNGVVFGSRPGAPIAAGDSMTGVGITAPIGSPEHDAAWKNFFNQAPPTQSPVATTPSSPDVAADENFGGGTSTGTPPAKPDPVATSIQTNQNWLRSNGVAFPPPPTPRASLYQTGKNAQTFPSLNSDPARMKGSAISPAGGVNPSYLASVQSFNRSLYQPADTRPAATAPVPGASVPTNWTSTSADQLAAIRQRYDTGMNNWLAAAPTNG